MPTTFADSADHFVPSSDSSHVAFDAAVLLDSVPSCVRLRSLGKVRAEIKLFLEGNGRSHPIRSKLHKLVLWTNSHPNIPSISADMRMIVCRASLFAERQQIRPRYFTSNLAIYNAFQSEITNLPHWIAPHRPPRFCAFFAVQLSTLRARPVWPLFASTQLPLSMLEDSCPIR